MTKQEHITTVRALYPCVVIYMNKHVGTNLIRSQYGSKISKAPTDLAYAPVFERKKHQTLASLGRV